MNDVSKVTRLEIIDHSACSHCGGEAWIKTPGQKPKECGACGGSGVKGRQVVFWDTNKKIDLNIQDDGKTLKIFISDKGE